MPGGDRTGPTGGGPKKGRGLGYCADNDHAGYLSDQPAQGLGRGFRWGRRGRGHGIGQVRGWHNRSQVSYGPPRGYFVGDDQEIETIKAEPRNLRDTLQQILDKLDELAH